jgi:hypothetical protein
MIPRAVVQITSLTSLKTESFSNDFGEYSYKSEKEDLTFGYDLNRKLLEKFALKFKNKAFENRVQC